MVQCWPSLWEQGEKISPLGITGWVVRKKHASHEIYYHINMSVYHTYISTFSYIFGTFLASDYYLLGSRVQQEINQVYQANYTI